MPELLLTFANSSINPLLTLKKEDESIYGSLRPLEQKGKFTLVRDSYINPTKLARFLAQTSEELWLFHYGGHAGKHKLWMDEEAAHAQGISELIQKSSNLKLIVLNGCATYDQVDLLLKANAPIVIATSAPVGDTKATLFAEIFYENLAKGETIKEAFDIAKGSINTIANNVPWDLSRDRVGNSKKTEPAWGIFYYPEFNPVLNDRLPGFERTAIYFSYAGKGESSDQKKGNPSKIIVMDELLDSLESEDFLVKKDIDYGASIIAALKESGRGELIVLFLSEAYLKSFNCLFELSEILRNSKREPELLTKRVLPIWVERINLGEPDILEKYFDYWESEKAKWDNLRTRMASHEVSDKYIRISKIIQEFGDLAGYLKDIHSPPPGELAENGFKVVKDTIRDRLKNI